MLGSVTRLMPSARTGAGPTPAPEASIVLPPAPSSELDGVREDRRAGRVERDPETDTEGDGSHGRATRAFWAKLPCK